MKKTIIALVLAVLLTLAGCGTAAKTETESKPVSSTTPKKETVKIESQLPDFEWKSHPQDFKIVAFTFDDAPSFADTADNASVTIINTLNKYEGAGTFFVIGKKITSNGTALLKFALQHGFELGNHSFNHEHMSEMNSTQIISEIEMTNKTLKKKFGVDVKWFRPPFFDTSANVYTATSALEMPCIKGNVGMSLHDGTTDDNYDNNYIRDTCLANIYDGEIICMHGFNKYTALALPEICDKLYKDGYRFATLTELFEMKGTKDIPCNRLVSDAALN